MTTYAFAAELKGPWVVTTHRSTTYQAAPEGILMLELDAASMASLKGLYQEFATAFKFPDYFGNNFNALDECITDLEWLPAAGYLLIIKNAEVLLIKESDDALKGLLSILDSAGEEWSAPIIQGEDWDREGVPFHTILELNKSEVSSFQSRLSKLGLEIQSLETDGDTQCAEQNRQETGGESQTGSQEVKPDEVKPDSHSNKTRFLT
jgi:RNAse (barnase) inhibitor barstar